MTKTIPAKPLIKTVSAGGILSTKLNGQILLLCITLPGGGLTFPKGRVRPKESFSQAAVREVIEEVGLQSVHVVRKLDTIRRQGTNHAGHTVDKTIHFFLMRGAGYTYVHEEDYVWIEARRVVKLLTSTEERRLLRRHWSIICRTTSPYFAKASLAQQWDRQHAHYLTDDRRAVTPHQEVLDIAQRYLRKDGRVFEIGVSTGRDALALSTTKHADMYGLDFSPRALRAATDRFRRAKRARWFHPICRDAGNILAADIPERIDLFYSRCSLNLSDQKTFFLFNEILKKLRRGGYFIFEGKTSRDYKVKSGTTVGPHLVRDSHGFLIRTWDEQYVRQYLVRKLHLKPVMIERKPYSWFGSQGETLYCVLKKTTSYAY